MLTYFLIALAAAFGWLVKDAIELGKNFSIAKNWKRYVGCVGAGLLYSLLSGWPVFRYLSVVAVIYFVGASFEAVINALNWVLVKLGLKKIQA